MTSTARKVTEQVCVNVKTRSREVLDSTVGKLAVLTDTRRLPQALQANAPPCRFQFIIHRSSYRWYGQRFKNKPQTTTSQVVAV
jgi:hypothetical protein